MASPRTHPDDTGPAVDLQPVDGTNWRDVADLTLEPEDRAFVAEPSRYLALCCYGASGWRPLAIVAGGDVVGFLMWAVDPADGHCWLGGIVVDARRRGRGYGAAAVRAAIRLLRDTEGHRRFALSYGPDNGRARALYARLGFRETGEREGDETVARYRAEE